MFIYNLFHFCKVLNSCKVLPILLFQEHAVFPKVNWSQSYKGVRITGCSIKFTGHSHTPQRRCSDSYWSLGPIMNNLLLDQTNFYWILPHVGRTLGMTELVVYTKFNIYGFFVHVCPVRKIIIYVLNYMNIHYLSISFLTWFIVSSKIWSSPLFFIPWYPITSQQTKW